MQYRSPSSFLGEPVRRPLDKDAIRLGRKRLLAELELSASPNIEICGAFFTKDDILRYCDGLIEEDALLYHNAVEEDRVLLQFLETGTLPGREKFSDNHLYDDPAFINWISPFFIEVFFPIVEDCFLNVNQSALRLMLGNRLLMTGDDQRQVWDYVRRTLDGDIQFLKSYLDTSLPDLERPAYVAILPLMSVEYIGLIRLLPAGYFEEVWDRYALSMVEVAQSMFDLQVEEGRSMMWTYLDNARLLAVSPEMKNAIEERLERLI